MSILRPRSFTYFNCHLSRLSLRKWRGLRRRTIGHRLPSLVDQLKRYPLENMLHDDLVDSLVEINKAFEDLPWV